MFLKIYINKRKKETMIDVEHDKRKINDDRCRLNKNEK